MKTLSELLYGSDYVEKVELFREKVNELHENYEGDFDVDSAYYIMQTSRNSNEVRLDLDTERDIPLELSNGIRAIFDEVWK